MTNIVSLSGFKEKKELEKAEGTFDVKKNETRPKNKGRGIVTIRMGQKVAVRFADGVMQPVLDPGLIPPPQGA